ncbi:MAG: hypothetical protein QXJ11_03485 [Candidatus Bathyarchaeia archaeon]
MGLYEILSESFPEEMTDFGPCLLIPHSAFKPEWSEQLKAEGVKVFQQSYNGRLFFFLKKANSNSQGETVGAITPTFAEQFKPKPFVWNSELIEKLKALRLKGLGHRAIARELNLKPHQVYRQLKKLEGDKADKPKTEALNCEGENDGLFREYLTASQLLYPRFKRATALLLREASKVLENG